MTERRVRECNFTDCRLWVREESLPRKERNRRRQIRAWLHVAPRLQDSLPCKTVFATSLPAQKGEDASQKSGHLIDHLLEYKMHTVLLP